MQKQLARMENDRKLQKPKYRFGLGGGSAGAGNQVVSRGNRETGLVDYQVTRVSGNR